MAILAMSGKLIWQLYVNKNHPVSQIFRKKYLKGGSLRKATAANTLTGTAIWNSYRKSFGFFNNHLFRIPSNGKRIHLWEDKIFGNPPLSSIIPLTELMNWATNKGLSRLADICSWDCVGYWIGWSLLDLPECLLPQKNLLFSTLSGLALVHYA